MKFVRFNLSLAGFRSGQVIPYHELEPGQQFWVDNEDILGSDRIAYFCDKDGKIIEPGDELEELVDLADEPVEDVVDDKESAPEESATDEIAPEETTLEEPDPDETITDETGTEDTTFDETTTDETGDPKELDFDFEESKETGDEPDQTKAVPESVDGTCMGIKADGTSCNNKAGDSGYCFRHINQA